MRGAKGRKAKGMTAQDIEKQKRADKRRAVYLERRRQERQRVQ